MSDCLMIEIPVECTTKVGHEKYINDGSKTIPTQCTCISTCI